MARKQVPLREVQPKDSKWVKPLRDPAVTDVLTAIDGVPTTEIYLNSYLSRSTISKLRHPKNGTKRPQHMTLVGVLGAIGMEYVIRRRK